MTARFPVFLGAARPWCAGSFLLLLALWMLAVRTLAQPCLPTLVASSAPTTFTYVSPLQVPGGGVLGVGNISSPSFTDLEGDGLLDLITGAFNGQFFHYRQSSSGAASFTYVGTLGTTGDSFDVDQYSSPRFVDLEGDGCWI